jgi:adenine-specific DNA methylase
LRARIHILKNYKYAARIEKEERMEKGRGKVPKKEIPEQEQEKIVSKSETIVEASPETNLRNNESSQNDDEDLLYTHKPENQGSGIQWNSAFCRKPGR